MKLKPLQDWVLIKSLEPEEKTAGGIIIPESAKEKPTEGIVLAVGPGKYKSDKEDEKKKKFVPTVLKPGQRIIYGKYSAREFEFDREKITMLREEDVLGTVEERDLAVRKSSAVEKKHERPVAVRKDSKATPASAAMKKTGEKKTVKKTKPVSKA